MTTNPHASRLCWGRDCLSGSSCRLAPHADRRPLGLPEPLRCLIDEQPVVGQQHDPSKAIMSGDATPRRLSLRAPAINSGDSPAEISWCKKSVLEGCHRDSLLPLQPPILGRPLSRVNEKTPAGAWCFVSKDVIRRTDARRPSSRAYRGRRESDATVIRQPSGRLVTRVGGRGGCDAPGLQTARWYVSGVTPQPPCYPRANLPPAASPRPE
jgi:hypothetical protein